MIPKIVAHFPAAENYPLTNRISHTFHHHLTTIFPPTATRKLKTPL